MPAQFGVFCAWQWRLEHTDHNWNSLMTAPVPVRDLYWSKFLLAAGVAVLGQVCIGVLYLLSGQLAGVSGGCPFSWRAGCSSGPWGAWRCVRCSFSSAW